MRYQLERTGQYQQLEVADLRDPSGVTCFQGLVSTVDIYMVYSDPPWSPGNEKWWRRHAKEDPPGEGGYEAFLDAWCRCVVAANPQHVFVEQSINDQHRRYLLDAIQRCPGWKFPLLEDFVAYYGNPARPNVVLHFGVSKLTTDPSGLKDVPMTRKVFEGVDLSSGHIVADPCIGKGMTSRLSHEFGASCIGTELNPDRLAKTAEWLTRKGYTKT